jgi:hypothetical protein
MLTIRDGEKIKLLPLLASPALGLACSLMSASLQKQSTALDKENPVLAQKIEAALSWAALVPPHLQDQVANMFLSR